MKCKIDSCKNDSHTRGWCSAHYKRVTRTGSADESTPLSGSAQTPQQRLESKSTLVPITGCRLWFGASVPHGYGVVFYQGRQQYAHRVSWQLEHGQIANRLCVLHACDVTSCVNPDHLFLGTLSDNSQDMVRKNRGNYKNHSKGEDHYFSKNIVKGDEHPMRKLNQLQVNEIRASYKPGVRQIDLAAKYGVKQSQISSIVRGASWV